MAHLIVEDEEAERLAAAIARETGQSIGAVVTEALRERAEKLPKRQGKASLEELRALAHEIASLATEPNIDHADLLYDEHGLPK
jgi:antitoxin VapB